MGLLIELNVAAIQSFFRQPLRFNFTQGRLKSFLQKLVINVIKPKMMPGAFASMTG